MIMIQKTDIKGSEIINHKMTHIDGAASVLEASKLMRKSGTAELLVTCKSCGQMVSLGIVTASDIVTRVVAAELDPTVLTMGDITWSGVCSTDATGSMAHAHGSGDEALAVLDGDGRLVGTLRLHEFIGMLSSHPESAP